MPRPSVVACIVVAALLMLWYIYKYMRPAGAQACDPASRAIQCTGGDACQCVGPNKGWCAAPDTTKFAHGYAWQGAWESPTIQDAICPDACAAAAQDAGHPNWVFQAGVLGENPSNCTHGHIVPGSCAEKADGYTSDLAAVDAGACGAGTGGCPLVVGPYGGAHCHADTDCPTGTTCGGDGRCSDNGCNTDEDCMLACCIGTACSDERPCPNGAKCTKSADGTGYMCCGTTPGSCKGSAATSCRNNKCVGVGLYSLSCDGPTGPYNPPDTVPLEAACAGKSLGGACTVDTGDFGTLNGHCGRGCDFPDDPLACYPESACWMKLNGKTTIDNPQGTCQSTRVTMGICFGS